MMLGRGILKTIFFLILVLIGSGPIGAAERFVNLVKVDGVINPLAAEFISNSIATSEKDGAQCLIIQLDTPGGLDTSMREIVKNMLNARVPIVVFVGPAGARAASAGVLITLAANVAVMAPGTNIGAAHPVAMGGKLGKEMSEKVENDAAAYIIGIANKRNRNAKWAEEAVRESVSIEAREALKQDVIDFVSPDLDDLLRQIDGRTVEVNGKKIILATKNVAVRELKMNARDRILDVLSNPNVAYILMMLGLAGLYFELAHPGAILPGVIGGICLILAFYAFQTLSVNYAGILLILLGVIFFIAEIKVASYGLLSIGGIIALLLGSLMLFSSSAPFMRLSSVVLITTVATTAAFFMAIASLAFRAYLRKPATGVEELMGMTGKALSRIAPTGRVFLHGEYWNASSDDPIEEGEEVEVVAVQGLEVKVKRVMNKNI